MDEQEIRTVLKEKGFEKIRKKYGQRYMPIISADKDGMRIWVEIPTNEYQTSTCIDNGIKRTHGNIKDLR